MDRSIIIAGIVLIASFLGCEPASAGELTDFVSSSWESHPFLTVAGLYIAYHIACELIASIIGD